LSAGRRSWLPSPLLLGVLYVFPLAFLLPFKYTPSLDFPPALPLSFLCSFRFDCRTLVYVSSYVFGWPAPLTPISFPTFFFFLFLPFFILFMACFEPCLNWFKISWHRLDNASFWQAQPQWTVEWGKAGRKAELITLLHTINNLMLCQDAYNTAKSIYYIKLIL